MKILILIGIILVSSVCRSFATNQQDSSQISSSSSSDECNAKNCVLPLCKCSNTERPNNYSMSDTPMMIALTFNGVIPKHYMKYIKKILNSVYKNPNNCPIQATFFVSDKKNGTTDYCVVQTLFNNNNEIAVSSPEYKCPYTDCGSLGKHLARPWKEESSEKDIFEQKKRIGLKARINRSFLRGFRLPHLDQAGSIHFKALKKYAFKYDSSVIVNPKDIRRHRGFRLWPHTLDYPPSYDCLTCPDKKSFCNRNTDPSVCSMNSVWIIPMHYFNAEGKHPCPTLIQDDIAQNRLDTIDCFPKSKLTQAILEQHLMDNFLRFYETSKAPFVINIEMSWFEKYGDMLTGALNKFINDLTNPNNKYAENKDIYFVSISKIIEWIEYPAPLRVIGNKWLWDCDGSNYDYDEECKIEQKLRENAEELEEIKKKNKTAKLELQTETLFRNGVLTGVIVVFIFSIIFTVIYDKFSSKK